MGFISHNEELHRARLPWAEPNQGEPGWAEPSQAGRSQVEVSQDVQRRATKLLKALEQKSHEECG